MVITLRKLTGGQVAFTVWRMPDGTPKVVKIAQKEYDEFAVTNAGVGDAPGRPDPEASFMLAAGGIPELDTVDGFPAAGDAYERIDKTTGKPVLVVATGDGPNWTYSSVKAQDTAKADTIRLVGASYEAKGNEAIVVDYDVADLSKVVVDVTPELIAVAIDTEVAK